MVRKSQLVILLTLVVCVILQPHVLLKLPQGGLSNFGTFQETRAIFSLGILTTILLLANSLSHLRNNVLRRIIILYAVGIAILAISTYPYKQNNVFEYIHLVVAFMFAIFQFGAAIGLVRLNRFDTYSKWCFAGLTLSLVLALLTATGVVGLLFVTQMVAGFSFGILLVHSMANASNEF